MLDLSRLLEKLFKLHGTVPRVLRRDGRAFLPIHMFMEVTYRCNLRCNFCQYLDIIEKRKEAPGPSKTDLPIADIKRWIDEFPRGRLISFSGGDVTVRKDFPEILAHACRRHRVHVITNGALIDEARARFYVEHAPRRVWQNGIVLFEWSLQGSERVHDEVVQRPGSWRKAVDGIRHMVRLRAEAGKRFPKFDLKIVVTKYTVGELPAFMTLAKDLGVEIVNFMAEQDLKGNSEGEQSRYLFREQPVPEGVDPALLRQQLIRCYELADELGLQIRLTPHLPIDEFARHYAQERPLDPAEYACEGLWSRIGVAADGRTGTVCHYFAGGDMRTQSLREAWNRESLRAFRRTVRDGQVFAGCHGCCNLTYTGPKELGLAGLRDPEPVRPAEWAPAPVLEPMGDPARRAPGASALRSRRPRA